MRIEREGDGYSIALRDVSLLELCQIITCVDMMKGLTGSDPTLVALKAELDQPIVEKVKET